MDETRSFLEQLARQLEAREELERAVPDASPPRPHKRLCVGMSTVNDFDGVCFTIQSMRLGHPDLLDEMSFLIVDNHPEHKTAAALRKLADTIPGVQYLPFRGYHSTAVRDLVFREADADVVMCVDSHVLLRPGSLQTVLDYFEAHPQSQDLVQGPLLDDTLHEVVATHFAPRWGAGMYGQWEKDDRIREAHCEPFEIAMQGLGVFACRKEAWPGINSRFRGFGGEEGYLHEKFRRQGGRVMCLPGLAWWHRFSRPGDLPYVVAWEDRIRNYHIGWAEVGWDEAAIDEHFLDVLGAGGGAPVVSQARRRVESPFMIFDAIFCLTADGELDRRAEMARRFRLLDIEWRVEWFPASASPGTGRGRILSYRSMVATARRRGYENVLILEDDTVFLDQTIAVLADAAADLEKCDWDLFLLGGSRASKPFDFVGDSVVLRTVSGIAGAHAVAVNHSIYERVLEELPDRDGAEMDAFRSTFAGIEEYFNHLVASGECQAVDTLPRLSSSPSLLEGEDIALAERYIT